MRSELLLLESMLAGPGRTLSSGQKVDAAAAERGSAVYTQYCINCHGAAARGTDDGPDLIRSAAGAAGSSGQRARSGAEDARESQYGDLTQRAGDRSHSFPEAAGGSDGEESQSGEASERADRRRAAGTRLLQWRGEVQHLSFANGRSGRRRHSATTRSICSSVSCFRDARKPSASDGNAASGPAVTGNARQRIDDFDVSLRDAAGEYHAWTRGPDLKRRNQDPLRQHHEMLDQLHGSGHSRRRALSGDA